MSLPSLSHAFGEVVLLHRRRRRLSQERLAERTGLSRNAIGLVERGEVVPSLSTVFAIASALDLAPSVLVAATEQHRAASLVSSAVEGAATPTAAGRPRTTPRAAGPGRRR